MPPARLVPMALVLLLPTAAPGAAYDPNLHVDPSVEDCSIRFSPSLTQDAFRRFAREFGSVSAFKQGAPPTAMGQWNVAVDAEQIFFSVDDKSAAWNDTFVHPSAYHPLGSSKSFPKLRLRIGATDELDLGAFFTKSLEANYGWLGVEAKYAALRQDDDVPVALAVRAAYTKTLYVSDMDMHAVTADVSVGRTFWKAVTPYLAVGGDVVLARETTDAVNLKNEALFVPHLVGGLEVRWWHVALGAEAQVGALTTYQAQVSAVF